MMIKNNMQYPAKLVVDIFSMIARCGILLLLYWYVFKIKGGVVNGVTFQIAAWSMFLYFCFMILRLRDIALLIMQDIKSGTVEILLSKPINYLIYRIWWQFGSGLYSFFFASILGSVALFFIIGIPATMTHVFFVFSLILVFILSVILSIFIYSIVGLLAFWMEDIKPLFWIVDKAVMILGGSYLPVALFPKIMYQIAIWSPFGASQFITHIVYDSWKYNYLKLFGIQILWIIILGIMVSFIFRRAHKKVSVNGG